MPCISTVRVWYNDKNVPVKYKLFCEGNCKDEDAKPCKPKTSTVGDAKQTEITEVCACNGGDETGPAECHIVLVTVHKPPSAAGETKFHCRGKECDKKGEVCAPVPVATHELPIPDKDGGFTGKMGKWIDFRCECQPKEDVW
jgi:hypothetical protein